MPAPVKGWAVHDANGINVRSVSPTRIAAIINYLCTDRGLPMLNTATTKDIEKAWALYRRDAEVIEVDISPR